MAWTYYGLGHDLLGTPNDARRERLAYLLRVLAMPGGTHTFWPVGLPSADEEGNAVLEPDARRFWEGLTLLGARVLVVMGSPAAGAAGVAGALRPLSPAPAVNGVRVLVTWDVDLLDDPGRLRDTGEFLRNMLSRLL